ncbi:MAG: hypothetical protein AAFQ82_20695, partial [Myxococcota bacterium]
CTEASVWLHEGRYDLAASPLGEGGSPHLFVWDAGEDVLFGPSLSAIRVTAADQNDVGLPSTIDIPGELSTTQDEESGGWVSQWQILEASRRGNTARVVAEDFTGNGLDDVLVWAYAQEQFEFFPAPSSGEGFDGPTLVTAAFPARAACFADFSLNGRTGALFAQFDGVSTQLELFESDGVDLSSTSSVTLATLNSPIDSMVCDDFDQDGDVDLAVVDDNDMLWFVERDAGTFSVFPAPDSVSGFADGRADIGTGENNERDNFFAFRPSPSQTAVVAKADDENAFMVRPFSADDATRFPVATVERASAGDISDVAPLSSGVRAPGLLALCVEVDGRFEIVVLAGEQLEERYRSTVGPGSTCSLGVFRGERDRLVFGALDLNGGPKPAYFFQVNADGEVALAGQWDAGTIALPADEGVVTTGDTDGDGHDEWIHVAGSAVGQIVIIHRRAAGFDGASLFERTDFFEGISSDFSGRSQVVLADLNADLITDVVAADLSQSTAVVLVQSGRLGFGEGRFVEPSRIRVPELGSRGWGVFDVNHDGISDFVANRFDGVTWLPGSIGASP